MLSVALKETDEHSLCRRRPAGLGTLGFIAILSSVCAIRDRFEKLPGLPRDEIAARTSRVAGELLQLLSRRPVAALQAELQRDPSDSEERLEKARLARLGRHPIEVVRRVHAEMAFHSGREPLDVESIPEGSPTVEGEKMSELLDALILQRKQEALDYKVYLAKIVELTKQVSQPETHTSYPAEISSPALRALFDNLDGAQASVVREPPVRYGFEPGMEGRVTKALALDRAIRQVKKADWRGDKFKEREIRNAISRLCRHRSFGGLTSIGFRRLFQVDLDRPTLLASRRAPFAPAIHSDPRVSDADGRAPPLPVRGYCIGRSRRGVDGGCREGAVAARSGRAPSR